jgi:hypothetical protein
MEDLRNVYVCKKSRMGDLRTITKGKFDKGSRSVVIKRKFNCEYFEAERHSNNAYFTGKTLIEYCTVFVLPSIPHYIYRSETCLVFP